MKKKNKNARYVRSKHLRTMEKWSYDKESKLFYLEIGENNTGKQLVELRTEYFDYNNSPVLFRIDENTLRYPYIKICVMINETYNSIIDINDHSLKEIFLHNPKITKAEAWYVIYDPILDIYNHKKYIDYNGKPKTLTDFLTITYDKFFSIIMKNKKFYCGMAIECKKLRKRRK